MASESATLCPVAYSAICEFRGIGLAILATASQYQGNQPRSIAAYGYSAAQNEQQLTMNTAGFLNYLALPLQAAPLLLVLIFSVLVTLAMSVGPFGIPLLLIILSWFFKYSFVLMDHVANGYTEPPVLSIEMVNPANEQRPLGLLLMVVVFYKLTGILGFYIGEGVMTLLRALGIALLPAVIAAMGATQSLIRGLSPKLALGLVILAPAGYVALLGVLTVLWLVLPIAAAALGITTAVPEVLVTATLMLMWLATFACSGGLVYEYRHELGHEASVSPEGTQARRDAERERERDRIMDGLFAQWRAGPHQDGYATISRIFADSSQPLAEYRWLYTRAAAWEDQRLASHLARWAVPHLIETRATGELLDLIRARLRADPDFRPISVAELLTVAKLAHDGGASCVARTLLQDFERHFPGDPAIEIVSHMRESSGCSLPAR